MKTFISIAFLTVALSLFSQNTKIDSLQQKLNHSKGTERITVLNDLAYAYGYVDFNKSISLAKEALYLAETLKYNKAKALTYDILGRAYFISGNNKVAEEYYNKCLSIAKKYGNEDDIYKALRHKTILISTTCNIEQREVLVDSIGAIRIFKTYLNLTINKKNYIDFQEGLNSFVYVFYSLANENSTIKDLFEEFKIKSKNDNELLAVIYANEGLLYRFRLEYFRAIEKYLNALKLTKSVSNQITYLERIGVYYFELKKYSEAEHFFKEALQLHLSKHKDSSEFIFYLINVDLGANYIQKKDYKMALTHLLKANQCDKFCERDKGVILGNLGNAYQLLDSLQKAELYYSKASIIFERLNNKNDLLGMLNSKAELLKKQHRNSQLSKVIHQMAELESKVHEYYIVYDSYKLLSDYYEKSGDYKRSNKYLKKWITANDSINNKELATKMKEFEFKYETEKKEQQIALQQDIIKNKNQLLVFSAVSGSLILAALLVIFILYRIRNRAYKQLVYQNLENTTYAQPLEIEDNTDEENAVEIKNGNSSLDDGLKNQIEIALNKQLGAKVYLESNIILKTLAEKCDTNRSYLSQFINEQYNMNFNTFINTLRINEAKKILSDINNNIPLKELYLQLGFNTYSVFNEAFKKHVGVTPAFFLKTVKDLYSVSNPNKIQ